VGQIGNLRPSGTRPARASTNTAHLFVGQTIAFGGLSSLAKARQLHRTPAGRLAYNCTQMQVEWDPGKPRLNARKHRVALADAVAVLEDETALTMRDPFPDDEERWIAPGLDAFG
jgi:hypothetical protein